jgi:hypothetical protein
LLNCFNLCRYFGSICDWKRVIFFKKKIKTQCKRKTKEGIEKGTTNIFTTCRIQRNQNEKRKYVKVCKKSLKKKNYCQKITSSNHIKQKMNQTELPWLGEIEPMYYFIVKYQEWDADGGEYNEIAACIDDWERALEYFHKKN